MGSELVQVPWVDMTISLLIMVVPAPGPFAQQGGLHGSPALLWQWDIWYVPGTGGPCDQPAVQPGALGLRWVDSLGLQ